jgi:hypothetical protein
MAARFWLNRARGASSRSSSNNTRAVFRDGPWFFGDDHDQRIHDAQKQATYRPDENATDRARLDNADTRVANDAGGRKGNEAAATEATNKERSGPRRESEIDAAELIAETAGSPEWANPPCR